MRLLNVIELDPLTFQMTVLEGERQRTYTLQVRVERWHDGDRYVPRSDPRHDRLWELFEAWRIKRKLDAFIEIETPIKYELPPVPVLPRR